MAVAPSIPAPAGRPPPTAGNAVPDTDISKEKGEGTEGTATGGKRGRASFADDPRPWYPGLNIVENTDKATGKPVFEAQNKLEKCPEDFDSDKYKPLRKNDFVDPSAFMEYKAEGYDKLAAACRKEAEELRLLGTGETQKEAKKAIDMAKRLEELFGNLKNSGVDIEALKARIGAM